MKYVDKVLIVGIILAISSYGELITFDDLAWGPYDEEASFPNEVHVIGDGYHGLMWDQFGVCNPKNAEYLRGSGYENGIVSGEWVAFNLWSNVATIEGGPFNFESAYLTSAWVDTLAVNIKGIRNGIELYNQTVIVSRSVPSYFEFNFKGIDQLVFSSDVHFAIDNLSYSYCYSNVTEPSSLLAILMGLFGLVTFARFYRK